MFSDKLQPSAGKAGRTVLAVARCEACGEALSTFAVICPACGAALPAPTSRRQGGATRTSSRIAVLTGMAGGVCAVASALPYGVVLLPLAGVLSVVSLVRSLSSLGAAGIATAILSSLLTLFAAAATPAEALAWLMPLGHSTAGAPIASLARPAPVIAAPVTPVVTKQESRRPESLPLPPLPTAPDATWDPPAEGKPRVPAPVPEQGPSVGTGVLPAAAPPQAAAKVDLPPWPADSAAQVKAIQILLTDLDLYHGSTHGTLGPATRAAIRDFQRLEGELETGEPSEALFDALQKRRAQAIATGKSP
jgi:hypothetical protein